MDPVNNDQEVSILISQATALAEDDPGSEKISQKLAELVENDKISLLQFIQALGPTLTSESDLTRSKGFKCLAVVLQKIGEQKLLKQDVNVLLEFLLNKIDDKNCLMYIFESIGCLIKFKNFRFSINDNAAKILRSVKDRYDPKGHLARVRFHPFSIVQTLLSINPLYYSTSTTNADLLVASFLHIADGEKDPRNLLLSFEINASINEKLSFDDNSEKHQDYVRELYDVCFCYFPISFTPPANDPYKITAEVLKTKLRKAIASQSGYAKDVFNDLLEKLTSTNPVVRNDVLKTLLLCVNDYEVDTLAEYWLTIWNALKFELLHNDVSIFKPYHPYIIDPGFDEKIDDTDEFKPLITTLVIVQQLCVKLSEGGLVDNYLATVIGDLKENLVTLNAKYYRQAILILSVVSSASVVSFDEVVKFLFSKNGLGKYIRSDIDQPDADSMEIDKTEDMTLSVAMQRDLIDNLGFIFISYGVLSEGLDETSGFFRSNSLLDLKDHLLVFMGQLLHASSNLEKTLKCKVIQQLLSLSQLRSYLTVNENELILKYFDDIIITIVQSGSNWENDVVLKEVTNSLIKYMSKDGDDKNLRTTMVINLILPSLLEELNPAKENELNAEYLSKYKKVLNFVGQLSVNPQLLEVLSIRLSNKLTVYKDLDAIKFELFKTVVNVLVDSIERTQQTTQFSMNSWYQHFLPRFLKVTIQVLKGGGDNYAVEISGDLIGLIVRFNDKSKHQNILNDFVAAFITKTTNQLGINEYLFESLTRFISLLNKVLANIDKGTTLVLPNSDENTFLDQVVELCYDDKDEYAKLGYLQTLCLMSNKFLINSHHLQAVLQAKVETLTEISNSERELDTRLVEDLEVSVWIIKALVMRLDTIGLKHVEILFDLLTCNQKEILRLVATAFEVLVIDLPIFTNKIAAKKTKPVSGVQNLNVRLLYKQKLFDTLLPKLLEGYKTAQDTRRENYLTALSLLVDNVPQAVLKSHLPDILPLIMNSLDLKNGVILKASLVTIELIINESPALVVPHMSKLIDNLLGLVVNKDLAGKKRVNNSEIRKLAMKCLMGIFVNMELPTVLPYRSLVLAKLQKALDDPKRDVRKLSCDIRQIIYELDR